MWLLLRLIQITPCMANWLTASSNKDDNSSTCNGSLENVPKATGVLHRAGTVDTVSVHLTWELGRRPSCDVLLIHCVMAIRSSKCKSALHFCGFGAAVFPKSTTVSCCFVWAPEFSTLISLSSDLGFNLCAIFSQFPFNSVNFLKTTLFVTGSNGTASV